MNKIKVSKVDNVTLLRQGKRFEGTLHIMPHHIIFHPLPTKSVPKPRELWITYTMIASCVYRPAPTGSHQAPAIRLRGRDFVYVAFNFKDEKCAEDLYESIRALSCQMGRIEKLYAFSYRPIPPEKPFDGWKIYDPRQEFKRQGISAKSSSKGWRITEINHDYELSPTYPAVMVVPSSISDSTIRYGASFRSRCRIPALTYLHPVNNCSITRSSQPMVGVRGRRSIQDEKLVAAIFNTTNSTQTAIAKEHSHQSSESNLNPPSDLPASLDSSSTSQESSFVDPETVENEALPKAGTASGESAQKIYGAQQSNLIVDARPTVNAYAMQAVGLGSENMDNYPFATKAYLGIDNIHVMRDSLNKVVEAFKDTDLTPLGPNKDLLVRSNWLKHIAGLLDGACLIARQVAIQHSHVLIHCSDGWDRTSQLSALSQLCLDPYYRTIDGFITLVEKDWLSFGHMFRHRSGFLGSEKWFEIDEDRISRNKRQENGIGPIQSGGSAIENAFLSAKGFFNKRNDSHESLGDSEDEARVFDPSSSPKHSGSAGKDANEVKVITKVKEISPVFHQFLDATYQMLQQFPTRFEFGERFLRRLLYHLYSCQYGTFLYDNEKQRAEARVAEKTRSVWDYFLSQREGFLNPNYDPEIDDNNRDKERLIFPDPHRLKWWNEFFGREAQEMNTPQPRVGFPKENHVGEAIVVGAETAEDAANSQAPESSPNEPPIDAIRPPPAERIAAGLAGLGISGKVSPIGSRPRTPSGLRSEVEVEMQ